MLVDNTLLQQLVRLSQVKPGAQVNRQHMVTNHQQATQPPLLTIGNATLLQIGFSTGYLVVMKMQMTANPGIDCDRSCQINAKHHQMMHKLVLFEVHPVDKIVLQLVQQGCPESGEQNHCPGRHDADQIQPGINADASEADSKYAETDGILMTQPTMATTNIITDGDDFFLDNLVGIGRSAFGRVSHNHSPAI